MIAILMLPRSTHSQQKVQVKLMLSLIHREQLKFNKDVSMMRAGNRQYHLLIDSDYDQIMIINLSNSETKSIMFPASVDEFLIYTWLVSPNGGLSLLLSSDPLDFGLVLNHRRLASKKVEIPSNFPFITELCWMAPTLNMLDYNGNIWVLENDVIVAANPKSYHKEPANTYINLIQKYTVLKPEHRDGGVYVMDREHTTIGYVSIPPGKKNLVSLGGDYPMDVVQCRERLFVCFEYGILQYYQGASQLMLSPTDGRCFRAMDLAYDENNAYLAVLSVMLDERARPKEFIDIYTLV